VFDSFVGELGSIGRNKDVLVQSAPPLLQASQLRPSSERALTWIKKARGAQKRVADLDQCRLA
jgi:hypothetical protein